MHRIESSPHPVQAVCVFCGSSPGADPAFLTEATALGRLIGEAGRNLVYGGAKLGLMGALADAALGAGGKVIGVLPRALVGKEIAHESLTDLRIVETMHERKAAMADLAGAFVGMPGGLGTLEEFFEMWTWGQLGLHQKPLALFGTQDFFTPLLDFLDRPRGAAVRLGRAPPDADRGGRSGAAAGQPGRLPARLPPEVDRSNRDLTPPLTAPPFRSSVAPMIDAELFRGPGRMPRPCAGRRGG